MCVTAFLNLLKYLDRHFFLNSVHPKMAPNQFHTSISILLEVFSQLAALRFPPEPFREHPCTCECQTDHRNNLQGKTDRRGVDSQSELTPEII